MECSQVSISIIYKDRAAKMIATLQKNNPYHNRSSRSKSIKVTGRIEWSGLLSYKLGYRPIHNPQCR